MPIRKSSKDKGKGKFKGKKRPSKFGPFKKKSCEFCRRGTPPIDYKNIQKLQKLTSERGKILPNRISGNCPKHQREVAEAIKRARFIALIPFVVGHK